jgi:hypothetical protein
MVHECRCGCIQLCENPVDIAAKGAFSTQLKTPPLQTPEVEFLVEGLKAGERVLYRVYPADKEVKIGNVVVVLKDLSTEGEDKDEAVRELAVLLGHAVVQAWRRLATSDNPEEVEAARSMEAPPLPTHCPLCDTEFVCSECSAPSMITGRCAYNADPPMCRKPDELPLLCVECYTKKALAEEEENEQR